MKILVIDNYDSFTYNLVHYLEAMDGVEVTVVVNDKIDLDGLLDYDRIVISPGPGLPKDAGLLLAAVDKVVGKRPILGVCLGMQAILEHFGGELYNLETVVHGEATYMDVHEDGMLYEGLERELEVGRYHSWGIKRETLPASFSVTASTKDGVVMSVEGPKCTGVQFHPESIMTIEGRDMLENWVQKSSDTK